MQSHLQSTQLIKTLLLMPRVPIAGFRPIVRTISIWFACRKNHSTNVGHKFLAAQLSRAQQGEACESACELAPALACCAVVSLFSIRVRGTRRRVRPLIRLIVRPSFETLRWVLGLRPWLDFTSPGTTGLLARVPGLYRVSQRRDPEKLYCNISTMPKSRS